MPRRLTQSELARELSVSRQAIHRLVQVGTLKFDDDGRIDLAQAHASIANGVRPFGKTSQAVVEVAPAPSVEPSPPPRAAPCVPPLSAPVDETDDDDDASEGAAMTFLEARTLNEIETLRMNAIKRRALEGELIRLDAVRSVIANTLAATREALLQLPARLAPVLAAESSAARVHELVQREIHQALGQLASLPERVGPEAQVEGQP